MTIGMAATGPNAGLALIEALKAVEAAGRGSIGGFCTFAAIDGSGTVHRAETQRGGSTTLFIDGETTGVAPPPEVAAAPFAALISSGPERPAPLAQFVAASEAGLVTGHRLPNGAGRDGKPYNAAALARIEAGETPEAAVRAVLDADPAGDVGLIALDRRGRIFSDNSARVAQRPDTARAERSLGARAHVAVLLNAIRPPASLAALAAEVALETLGAAPVADGRIAVAAGTPLAAGQRDAVEVDAEGRVLRVVTCDDRLTTGRHNAAAIYLGAEVRRDGEVLGRTLFEPNCMVADGRIVSLNGGERIFVTYA